MLKINCNEYGKTFLIFIMTVTGPHKYSKTLMFVCVCILLENAFIFLFSITFSYAGKREMKLRDQIVSWRLGTTFIFYSAWQILVVMCVAGESVA